MGERHSGDGPCGRRPVHPGGTLSAPDHAEVARAGSGLEERLGAALRADGVDAEAERRAVAAFRAARATQSPRPRTRRRDDWRPAAPSRVRRSRKVTLSVLLASLTLGGVAVAAIGSAGSGTGGRPEAPRPAHPSTSEVRRPGTPGPSAESGAPGSGAPAGRPDHPATARDTVAHCRTYERAGERGGALDSTAWQRLVAAAGGADKVADYCAAQPTSAQGKKSGSGRSDRETGGSSGSGKSRVKSSNSGHKVTGKK
ncbi:hypothetical protein ACWC0C_37995 [Streptomyces sp. NPDC001709]